MFQLATQKQFEYPQLLAEGWVCRDVVEELCVELRNIFREGGGGGGPELGELGWQEVRVQGHTLAPGEGHVVGVVLPDVALVDPLGHPIQAVEGLVQGIGEAVVVGVGHVVFQLVQNDVQASLQDSPFLE